MPSAQSHWLQPERHIGRVFAGEQEAGKLVEWLNENRNGAQSKRMTELLDRIGALYRITALDTLSSRGKLLTRRRKILTVTELMESKKHVLRLLRRINKLLRAYKFQPQFTRRLYDLCVLWCPVWRDDQPGVRYTEHDAIHSLMELAANGCFHRVRRCQHCESWFYARFKHQKFCQTKCQQNHYRTSPEWKASRREWLRNHRRLVASGKVIEREIKRRRKT